MPTIADDLLNSIIVASDDMLHDFRLLVKECVCLLITVDVEINGYATRLQGQVKNGTGLRPEASINFLKLF